METRNKFGGFMAGSHSYLQSDSLYVSRGFAGLRSLLGEKIHGTVTSDRCKAYNPFSIELRQLCWSNLGRDF
jgi:hypothetical protein